jgi:anti-repressor protein
LNALIIGTQAIRQDAEGRYSLNDLHRSAGGEARHQPANWLRLGHTVEMVELISNSSDLRNCPLSADPGRYGGTFACTELVYAYAMWISPAFQLRVIRAFEALRSGAHTVPGDFASALRLAADQQEEIERQRLALAEAQPKVEFAEAVRSTVDAIGIRDMAKLLGTGQNRLFARLRADAILMADNRPYQSYIDRGYFRLVEMPWRDDDGQVHVSFKTLVTGKGQVWLQRRYSAPTTSISVRSAVQLAHANA